METKEEAVKSQIAIRCAKAAIVLYSLRNCPLHTTVNNEDEEKETMKKEIGDLKVKLAMERMKSKKIKLCGLAEVALQVMVVLLVSSFFLVIVLKSYEE